MMDSPCVYIGQPKLWEKQKESKRERIYRVIDPEKSRLLHIHILRVLFYLLYHGRIIIDCMRYRLISAHETEYRSMRSMRDIINTNDVSNSNRNSFIKTRQVSEAFRSFTHEILEMCISLHSTNIFAIHCTTHKLTRTLLVVSSSLGCPVWWHECERVGVREVWCTTTFSLHVWMAAAIFLFSSSLRWSALSLTLYLWLCCCIGRRLPMRAHHNFGGVFACGLAAAYTVANCRVINTSFLIFNICRVYLWGKTFITRRQK